MALLHSNAGLQVPGEHGDVSATLSARSSRRSLQSRLSSRRPISRSQQIVTEIQSEPQTADTPKTIDVRQY